MGKSTSNNKVLHKSIIAKAKKEVKDPAYLANILMAEQRYYKIGEQLPDSVLDKTYLRSQKDDEKMSLRMILEKYHGKALYLDFWASWCSPCRKNMRESEKVCQYLKEQHVEMLYFSLDTDTTRWIKAIQEDNVKSDSQYMCYENFRSPLCMYLQVKSIPRYVLFDKQHKLFLFEAPCSDENGFLHLKKVIEEVY